MFEYYLLDCLSVSLTAGIIFEFIFFKFLQWIYFRSRLIAIKIKNDVIKTADAVAESLKKAGADKVEICETAGYPLVYAEKIIDDKKPTILVYGHYDVQPADPLELWHSKPFEPVIKNDKIYARGACDSLDTLCVCVR